MSLTHRKQSASSAAMNSSFDGSSDGGLAFATSQQQQSSSSMLLVDDADAAAGQERQRLLDSAPPSSSNNSVTQQSDLEFFEDLVSDPVIVLGFDITHMPRQLQFVVCASGVFFFSLLYGYLQELISVQLCNRKLGLFLATAQFSGYTLLAYFVKQFVYSKHERQAKKQQQVTATVSSPNLLLSNHASAATSSATAFSTVPFQLYLGLSLLRAVDLGMTNLAMQYINYPAKTLMKSSRVVFTMLFGVVLARKRYACVDYLIVACMVAGLALFMHADANSSAVFSRTGVIMLTVSLVCDGAITNMSESIMKKFGVGQDEFIFRMYSIALVAITAAAAIKGDLREGLVWLSQPGTYDELSLPLEQRSWSAVGKISCLVLFSSMGFFGSSCSAAITKNFGALTMSITSTARKATTLFLSFFLFRNVCTLEHILGIVVFISALTAKSLRRRKDRKRSKKKRRRRRELELPLHSSGNMRLSSKSESVVSTRAAAEHGVDTILRSPRDHDPRLVMRRILSSEASISSSDGTGMRNSVHIV